MNAAENMDGLGGNALLQACIAFLIQVMTNVYGDRLQQRIQSIQADRNRTPPTPQELTADYDAARTAPVERVARVLAGHALSRNAEGDLASAGRAVDDLWPDYAPAALAVLRSLREPSGRMLAVGDADIWDRMITAAIEDESLSD